MQLQSQGGIVWLLLGSEQEPGCSGCYEQKSQDGAEADFRTKKSQAEEGRQERRDDKAGGHADGGHAAHEPEEQEQCR